MYISLGEISPCYQYRFLLQSNMSRLYLVAAIFLVLLCRFSNGNSNKHQEAEFRASLAKAKSIRDALVIIKTRGPTGRSLGTLITSDSINREEQSIIGRARELNKNSGLTMVPRNGGCEPRVICEEVPVDRDTNNNVISFPQCVEVHRCGGCCQEGQFQCIPVRQVPVTFSPLLLISVDTMVAEYQANGSLTLMNHTECECKCKKTEAECHQQGKTLDSTICQCIQPNCSPNCLSSSKCSTVHGSSTPRCTCNRRIPGQSGNYCSNPFERPNEMCRRCERAYGR